MPNTVIKVLLAVVVAGVLEVPDSEACSQRRQVSPRNKIMIKDVISQAQNQKKHLLFSQAAQCLLANSPTRIEMTK